MPRTQVQQSVRWSLAAIILATSTATANAGAFLRGCAARDMQILMLIEDRESKSTASAEKIRESMHTMMHARIVCHEGHILDALAIYNSIAQSIAPNPVESGRTRPPEIQ